MPQTDWGWLISPEELESWVELDNNDVLLINKPALVVCHPSKQGPWSSLAGAIKAHFEHTRSHLVSRLDRETSGITLFAKHRLSSRHHQMALQERKTQKTYLAILEGKLEKEILVDADLGQDKRSVIHCKSCVRTDGRRQDAQTRFTPLYAANGYSLVKVEPITGRKHQIRIHAQHIGHSVAGDKLYGPDENHFLDFIENGWTEEMAQALPLNRHALHAFRIEFSLESGERIYEAPLANDLIEFCETRLDMRKDTLKNLLENL